MVYKSWPKNKPKEPGLYVVVLKEKNGTGDWVKLHALNRFDGSNWVSNFETGIIKMIAFSEKIDEYKE